MTKVTAEVMGTQALMRDWGKVMKGQIYADSSAALAIASRKGRGELRHIHVGMLWTQEQRAQNVVQFEKIEGSRNPADRMTKHVCPSVLDRMRRELRAEFREGRASVGLQLSRGA